MHTTQTSGGTRFLHNGDYSGDVFVVVPAQSPNGKDTEMIVPIPFKAMKELVANYVRDFLIGYQEQADADTILGIKGNL